MYLDVADSSTLPYGWSRYAQFSLAVVNQLPDKSHLRKGERFIYFIILNFLIILSTSIFLTNCEERKQKC